MLASIRKSRINFMKALFVELPVFERHRQDYLDDDGYRSLQRGLLADPRLGVVIAGTGGLREPCCKERLRRDDEAKVV